MGLFLPTSGTSVVPLSTQRLAKVQIYCLDMNESLTFQFNPETFRWERDINWAEVQWKGNDFGGDLEYINNGPRTFDLPLSISPTREHRTLTIRHPMCPLRR